MFFGLFALTAALSAGACAILWTRRPVRPAFGYAGAGGWVIVALQAQNIRLYHHDGTSTLVGSEPFQYLAASLAILAIATVVMYHAGVYPPVTDSEASSAAIEDTTTNG